jgi:hypothetical protein
MTRKTIKFKSQFFPVLTLALLLITSQSLIGRNYYFSSTSGDDARTSTQAQNPATPWKTITKLNSFFASLAAGDSVLLKRGDTFYGSIVVSKSGTSSLRIVIGAFGTGNKPIVTGFTTVTGWTNEGNGIYSKVISAESQTNMVSIDGVQYGMGRFPNAGTYLTYESASTNVSITDKELTGTPNWTGAEAVITKNGWLIDRCLITNHTNSVITYSNLGTTTNATTPNNYFIQNDLRTLDQFGEWYHNTSTKKFYMYFGTVVPTTKTVNVASLNYLLSCINPDYITIDNISFIGSIKENIKTANSDNSIIQNCTVNFSGRDGISLSGVGYIIRNNSISNSNRVAIYSVGGNVSINDNTILNTCIIEGQGNLAPFYNGAIFIYDNIFTISGNSITNCGFNGTNISSLVKTGTIKTNFLYNTCTLRPDQGSIYVTGNKTSITISQNTVLDSKANGIFIDEYGTNVSVTNNTVANCVSGLKLHKANHNLISGNTLYNSGSNIDIQNWLNEDNIGYNNFSNNISVAKTASQYVIAYYTRYTNYAASFASSSFSSNYYARPIDDNNTFLTSLPSIGTQYKSLVQWQTLAGQDVTSHKSPKSITSTNDLRFEYNATSSSKVISLDANYIDVKGTNYNGTITLAPYSSAVLIKTGTSSNQAPTIQNQSFLINSNSAIGTVVGTVIATEPDAGQTKTFSITSGNTNGAFSINSTSGLLNVAKADAFTASTSYSIFQSAALPSGSGNAIGSSPLEAGMKFSSNVDGYISGLKYYKGVGAQGTHIGNLWNSNGTKLATATFTGETASGWQTVTFANPIAIKANTIYVVSYYSPHGDFVFSNNYFTSNVINGPITALASTASQLNGVYAYGSSSTFPTQSYQARNFWADVIFSSSAPTSTSFALVVKVQDNGTPSLSNQATITINLNTIKSQSVLNITSIPPDFVSVGSPYRYEVTGSSGDENRIDFTAADLPFWLHFTDNGNNTGTLEGIPGNQDTGSYQIMLDGKDFSQSVQQVFKLQVKANPSADILKQTGNGMHIYPNPVTNGKLNIELNEEITEHFELHILDLTGKLILKKQYEHASVMSLDVSSYPPALYLIQIRSDRFQFSDKFIIR